MRSSVVPWAIVGLACLIAYRTAASGRLDAPGRLEAATGAIALVAGLVYCAFRRPGLLPGALLLVVSLVPYQVSFVGKTPFGVVSTAGALGFVGIATLFVAHARGRRELFRGPEITAMVVWSVLMTAAGVMSSDPRLSLNITRTIVVAMPLAYVAGRLIADLDPRALQRVVVVAVGLSAVAVVEELTSFTPYSFFPSDGFPLVAPEPATREGLERVRLGYYHGSTLGVAFAVALPLVVLHPRLGLRRRPWLIGLLIAGVFFTVTFQVWMASIVVLALLGLGLKQVRVGLAAAAICGALVVGSGFFAPLNQLIENRIHPTGSHADEYSYRLQLWPAALSAASEGPLLGEGPGMFNQLGLTGTVRGLTVRLVNDNTFTSKLVETGYVGTAALLMALFLVVRRMWRHTERWRAWAGIAALGAWLSMAMSVELLSSDQALLPVWLVIGMLSLDPKARQAK